jgi:hypothetical protein
MLLSQFQNLQHSWLENFGQSKKMVRGTEHAEHGAIQPRSLQSFRGNHFHLTVCDTVWPKDKPRDSLEQRWCSDRPSCVGSKAQWAAARVDL